jgi:hypothetical protein
MLAVPELPDQRDHVEPELAVRQRQRALLLGTIRPLIPRARCGPTAADHQRELDDLVQER